jgi:ABC-type lipopolysaccharide export system ATPase subunit
LGTTRLVESAIKKVSFNTRLESKSHLAVAGEFTDYTARYFSIRADEEEATTLRKHLEQYLQKDNEAPATAEQTAFLEETTRQLKLDHLLDIPLVALSNGQTRRARIARALLMKPEVLILEEPFSGCR